MFHYFPKPRKICSRNVYLAYLNIFKNSLKGTKNLSSSVSKESEEEKAKAACDTGGPTVFDKIISKEIKTEILYEDETCIAFNDANPQAPVHFLVIPKRRISMLEKAKDSDEQILGKLLLVVRKLASERLAEGFRVVINNGVHGSQSVYHLHLHVLGGRQMKWPPG